AEAAIDARYRGLAGDTGERARAGVEAHRAVRALEEMAGRRLNVGQRFRRSVEARAQQPDAGLVSLAAETVAQGEPDGRGRAHELVGELPGEPLAVGADGE